MGCMVRKWKSGSGFSRCSFMKDMKILSDDDPRIAVRYSRFQSISSRSKVKINLPICLAE